MSSVGSKKNVPPPPVGVGDGVGLGDGLGTTLGDSEGVGLGLGLGTTLGLGDGVGDGLGDAVPPEVIISSTGAFAPSLLSILARLPLLVVILIE